MDTFLAGVLAGYGIAIPVGAIAILIVEIGMRCGFRCAAFAGAGAATADLVYAAAAVVGGAAVASIIERAEGPFRYVSAAALAAIAILGLRKIRHERGRPVRVEMPDRKELAGTYARFLGLTIINPLTVLYFAAFVVGLGVAEELSAIQGVVFVAGAFLASLSWQLLLAAVGAFAGRKLPDRFRTVTVVVGNVVVLLLAVAILVR